MDRGTAGSDVSQVSHPTWPIVSLAWRALPGGGSTPNLRMRSGGGQGETWMLLVHFRPVTSVSVRTYRCRGLSCCCRYQSVGAPRAERHYETALSDVDLHDVAVADVSHR